MIKLTKSKTIRHFSSPSTFLSMVLLSTQMISRAMRAKIRTSKSYNRKRLKKNWLKRNLKRRRMIKRKSIARTNHTFSLKLLWISLRSNKSRARTRWESPESQLCPRQNHQSLTWVENMIWLCNKSSKRRSHQSIKKFWSPTSSRSHLSSRKEMLKSEERQNPSLKLRNIATTEPFPRKETARKWLQAKRNKKYSSRRELKAKNKTSQRPTKSSNSSLKKILIRRVDSLITYSWLLEKVLLRQLTRKRRIMSIRSIRKVHTRSKRSTKRNHMLPVWFNWRLIFSLIKLLWAQLTRSRSQSSGLGLEISMTWT